MQEVHPRHGPVVEAGYGSGRMILLFGPEANGHVLSTAAHTFEWGEAMQALVAGDGPTALIVSDGDDHRRRRRPVQPAFSDRKRGGQGKRVSVSVDRGGRRIIKKKKKTVE